jgi:hypothetical protein
MRVNPLHEWSFGCHPGNPGGGAGRPAGVNGGEDVRYRRGELVTARRDFQGMNRPLVPEGTVGEIVNTTVLTGRPKTVRFQLMTEWGPKTFTTYVTNEDVERGA